MKRMDDGNFLLGGQTASHDGDVSGNHSLENYWDGWVIKISPDGNILWQQCFGGDLNDAIIDALPLDNGRILLTGCDSPPWNTGNVQCTNTPAGGDDLWLLMVQDTTATAINTLNKDVVKIELFPDPATDEIHVKFPSSLAGKRISVEIFNNLGSKVKTIQTSIPATSEIACNISALPSGMYFVLVNCEKRYLAGKFVRI
ncbi:MAG TPA: T9SS type A sorting domain-containing protein, partial [Methanosarcina sp.]|nr:T9SS type A sorting domain-containing protein [Methanosarcina sp.]